ncbi:hypothetical protein [Maribacter sp. Asnod1-A12]|uniref:hypothetical protein n=1 Tax=Maribacter sp. Asnod1-A12 TaxID=3160576 RepID=UPI0038630867
MKKAFYYIAIIGTLFVSCDPLEDINDDLDAQQIASKDFIVGVETYTLTDEDYELYAAELDSVEYFASQDLANLVIPSFLADTYPIWGEGSLVEVTYNLEATTVLESISTTEVLTGINDIDSYLATNYETASNGTFVELTYNVEDIDNQYVLTFDDYQSIATALSGAYPEATASMADFGNFERRSDNDAYWSDEMVIEAMNVILPMGSEGDIYVPTFDIYDGGFNYTETIVVEYIGGSYVSSSSEPNVVLVETTAIVVKNNGDWENPYVFSDEDYEVLEQGYGNFDSGSIYKLDIFLESLYPFAQAGDVAPVQYEFYNGSTSTKYGVSIFDGDKWELTPDVIETSFQYGFSNGEWEPDNTIAYSLLSADYATLGADASLAELFPSAAANLNSFGNFNRQGGSTTWTDEALLAAFNILLDNIDSSAAEGQKYLLSIDVYNGSSAIETFTVIKTDGVWVYVE